jgi:hypothetical protein
MSDEKTDASITSGLHLFATVVVPAPTKLILRDETGQAWAISVGPDGQLQTARHLDGEHGTATNQG